MKTGNTIVIVIVALIALGVYIGLSLTPAPVEAPATQTNQQQAPGTTQTPATSPGVPANLPPLTADVKAQLAQSHGFSVLVSYTGKNFEPADVSVKKGATIRFTNNSATTLHLCGDGVFGSCKTIPPKGFWEYTFGTTGNFAYHSDAKIGGVVRVK